MSQTSAAKRPTRAENQQRRPALLATTALQAAATLLLAGPAMAQLAPTARPQGGAVVAGQAALSQGPAQTTISQSSQRAAIDWGSYNVGSGHTVLYQQPGPTSVTLNRVTGPDPSQIAGRIQANGQIVITNRSGVIFQRGSQVDAQSLVVSSAGVTNQNFMAGKMAFDQPGRPGAKVSNAGNITVAATGLAALVAPQVANSGTITAKMGHVVLAGAASHTVDLYGDGLMSVDVTREIRRAPNGATALVTNTGTIAANGGTIVLTARAADGVMQNLVTAGGALRANTSRRKTRHHRRLRRRRDGDDRGQDPGAMAADPARPAAPLRWPPPTRRHQTGRPHLRERRRSGGTRRGRDHPGPGAGPRRQHPGRGRPRRHGRVRRAHQRRRQGRRVRGHGGAAVTRGHRDGRPGHGKRRFARRQRRPGEISARRGCPSPARSTRPPPPARPACSRSTRTALSSATTSRPTRRRPPRSPPTGAQSISAATFNAFATDIALQAQNTITLQGATALTNSHNITLGPGTNAAMTIAVNAPLTSTGGSVSLTAGAVGSLSVTAPVSALTTLALRGGTLNLQATPGPLLTAARMVRPGRSTWPAPAVRLRSRPAERSPSPRLRAISTSAPAPGCNSAPLR